MRALPEAIISCHDCSAWKHLHKAGTRLTILHWSPRKAGVSFPFKDIRIRGLCAHWLIRFVQHVEQLPWAVPGPDCPETIRYHLCSLGPTHPCPQYCVSVSQVHLEICYIRHSLLWNFQLTALGGTKLQESIWQFRSQELIMYLISLLWIFIKKNTKILWRPSRVVKLISGWDFPSSLQGLSLWAGIWARHTHDALQRLPWLVMLLMVLLKTWREHIFHVEPSSDSSIC